jgi:hypothetical protein
MKKIRHAMMGDHKERWDDDWQDGASPIEECATA